MRADIHPDYHEITIEKTDGTSFKTRSTWGKEGDVLKLDIDPTTHPAWKKDGGRLVNVKSQQMAKFANKFGNLGLGGEAAKEEENKDEDKK